MSRFKELKNSPENNINIVDMLSLICPEGKTKYIETLLRIMRSTENINEYRKDIIDSLNKDLDIDKNSLSEFDTLQIIFMKKFFDIMFEKGDLKMYQKFCEYNERNLVEENDVSIYKSFSQVQSVTDQVDLKLSEKEMEKQIVKVYEDDEWLVIKPLTFAASKKYGANTKWCTTSENDSMHFEKYAKGILIYTMNKKKNLKVATYKSLSDSEFSFWNATDNRVDSLDTDLPINILGEIRDHIKNCNRSNLSYIENTGHLGKAFK